MRFLECKLLDKPEYVFINLDAIIAVEEESANEDGIRGFDRCRVYVGAGGGSSSWFFVEGTAENFIERAATWAKNI